MNNLNQYQSKNTQNILIQYPSKDIRCIYCLRPGSFNNKVILQPKIKEQFDNFTFNCNFTYCKAKKQNYNMSNEYCVCISCVNICYKCKLVFCPTHINKMEQCLFYNDSKKFCLGSLCHDCTKELGKERCFYCEKFKKQFYTFLLCIKRLNYIKNIPIPILKIVFNKLLNQL